MSTLTAEALAEIGRGGTTDPASRAAAAAGALGRYRYLLLFRFALLNLAGLAFVGCALVEGWIQPILATDGTRLSLLIFVVFLAGLAAAGGKAAGGC